jgi:hypothetical protein
MEDNRDCEDNGENEVKDGCRRRCGEVKNGFCAAGNEEKGGHKGKKNEVGNEMENVRADEGGTDEEYQ